MADVKALVQTSFIVYLLILAIAIAGGGCATLGLSKNATTEQQQAAWCMDTRQAISLVQIGLGAMSKQEQRDVHKWVTAAQQAVDLYCGGK